MVAGFSIGMGRLILVIFEEYLKPEGILSWVVSLNWLHFCEALFVFTCLMIGFVSIFTGKPDPKRLEGLTFFSASPAQKRETRESWGIWDLIHTGVIIIAVAAFYTYFW